LVKREVVAVRLEKLRAYLKILKAAQEYDLSRFKSDPFIHGTAERYLHLSIECLLDIGNHIIADKGYRKPETYGEILEVLTDEGIIPRKLFLELEGMAAFRNVLVHDYMRLDIAKVYDVIKDKLKHFEDLARIYAGLL
jgi:uncharacterized protein YutE (UPF0331/DUF86 family)